LYTDTDSLILHIFTDNFYDDLKNHLDKFDTSNFEYENQFGIPKNESVVGKMKDEFGGKIIWKFYGTGAKAYMVNVEGKAVKKAKGVQESVRNKELTQDDYKNVVENKGTVNKLMKSFRSYNHQLYTELKKKVALSWKDDKRYIIQDTTETLAWGHYSLCNTPEEWNKDVS